MRARKPTVPQTNLSGYISKIVNNLELNGETEQLPLKILTRVSELRLTGGRGPGGTAAACVYISSHVTGDRRTQSEIAREAQVTEVTIRNRYKELTRRLNIKMIL